MPSVRDSLDRLEDPHESTLTVEGVYEEHTIPPNPLPADGDAQRSVVILGMHRSGTSVLAGSLQEAGLVLGDVVTQAPHNKKGNRENRAIMFMQEDLLQSNGGSWDNPPKNGALGEAASGGPRSFYRWFRGGKDLGLQGSTNPYYS